MELGLFDGAYENHDGDGPLVISNVFAMWVGSYINTGSGDCLPIL